MNGSSVNTSGLMCGLAATCGPPSRPILTISASPHINPDVFTLDPFMNLPSDRIVTADEMVGESNWLNSEYYKQFCEPAGVRYVMGADIHTEEGSECRLRICRPSEARPF